MKAPPIDPNDPNDLVGALSQALFFVEHLNARCTAQISKSKAENRLLQSIVLEVRDYLLRPNAQWTQNSDVTCLIKDAGLAPAVNPAIVDSLAKLLLAPAQIHDLGTHSELEGTSNLAKASPPDRLREDLWIYEIDGRYEFSGKNVLDDTGHVHKGVNGFYWDEPFDIISIMQRYLMDVLGVGQIETANMLIQRWIRLYFGIEYTDANKYLLNKVVRRINMLFYSKERPSLDDLHILRTPTLGTSLVINDILRTIKNHLASARGESSECSQILLRHAIGIFVALRFCRILRCRYHWIDWNSLNSPAPELGVLKRAAHRRQCISTLRSVEYTYLLARLFGSITNIPGLNFIFRGGMLPRTNSGRTLVISGPPGVGKTVFALQKMVGVATRGGLAVYFSFEESFEIILDRLVIFGLIDNDRFNILQVEASGANLDLEQALVNSARQQPKRGLLVLFGGADTSEYLLPEVISKIAEASRDWKWKALAIDSINALSFQHPHAGDPSENIAIRKRQQINYLIEAIEKSGFLGIILSEAGDDDFSSLPYLADTIIELGFDESRRSRWMEIKKCRSQSYHAGRHSYNLSEGRGARIYPSLSAIRSALRRKAKSTLSEVKKIHVPDIIDTNGLETRAIEEKSATLIYGPDNSGKTRLALRFSLEPVSRSADGINSSEDTSSLLIVNFRTPERRLAQTLRTDSRLLGKWDDLKYRRVRWYSPGGNVGGEQVISDIWGYIKDSRRKGCALERIVFDELESAEYILPLLQQDSLFWPTLIELVGAEALTSFFVFSEDHKNSESFRILSLSVDYIMRTTKNHQLLIEKRPDLRFDRSLHGST